MVTQFRTYARTKLDGIFSFCNTLLDNPRDVRIPFQKRQLAAMRQATLGRVPSDVRPEMLLVADDLEPECRPVDRTSTLRRLFFARLGFHAACRAELRIQARQFVLALLSFLAIAGLMTQFNLISLISDPLIADYTSKGLMVGLLMIGCYFGYLALGLSRDSYTLLIGDNLITAAEMADARDFAENVLIRSYATDAPEDLSDIFRPLTIDARGRPVDGQIVSHDLLNAYLRGALAGSLPVYGVMGAGLVISAVLGLSSSAWLGAAAGATTAGAALFFAAMRLFVLPSYSGLRMAIASMAIQNSPIAKLVDQKSKEAFVEMEADRQKQVAEAVADKSPLVTLGKSTGILAARRDVFAPSLAGMPMRLSAMDLTMNTLVTGDTGSGKTSCILRPMLAQWIDQDMGGAMVLCGKGQLVNDLRTVAGFRIISPDRDLYAPIEGMSPEDVTDGLAEMHSVKGDDEKSTWTGLAYEYLGSSSKILGLLSIIEPDTWKWTLGGLFDFCFGSRDKAKAIIEGKYARALPEMSGPLRRAWQHWAYSHPETPEKTRASIEVTLRGWFADLMGNSLLESWIDAEEGVRVEDVLLGERIGLHLPESEYGKAGNVISNFAKRRLYRAAQNRGDAWVKGEGGHRQALLMVDECQLLLTQADRKMLPITRSLGLSDCFATQTVDSVSTALGDKESALGETLAAFRNYVGLLTTNPATQKFMESRSGTSWKVVTTSMAAQAVDVMETAATIQLTESNYGDGTIAASYSRSAEISELRSPGIVGESVEIARGLLTKSGITKIWSLLPGALAEKRPNGSVSIGDFPNITAAEISSLLPARGRALACINRAGVTRRDIIQVRPMDNFNAKKGAA